MSVDPKSYKVIEDEEVKTILSTPTKPPLMSVWEGINAAAIIGGVGIPGDFVIITVDSRISSSMLA